MEKFRGHVRSHIKKHQTVLLIVIMLFIFTSAGICINYFYTQNALTTHYQKMFEKKSLNELELFHSSTEDIIRNFFHQALSIQENLSQDSGLQQSIAAKDTKRMEEILNRQRKTNQSFDALFIFDSKGTMLMVSVDNPEVKKFIGSNFAYRDYIQGPLTTKKVYIGNVYTSVFGGYNVFNISAPLFNEKGELVYIISGAIALDTVTQKIHITSQYAKFNSILLDNQGNLLLENGVNVKSKKNVKDSDRVVAELLSGEKAISDEEINYKGEKVFVQGSTINLGNNNQVYLVSYYPVAQFEDELQSVKSELDRIYVHLAVREFVLLFISFICIIFFIKRHDRIAKEI